MRLMMFRYAFLIFLLCAFPAFAESPYSFEVLKFTSADGGRSYRVVTAIPACAVPEGGYSVLYALDGNAALADFSEDVRTRTFREGAPVVVFIGYDTEERFDVDSRAFDYTPPSSDGKPVPDALRSTRMNGGAAMYLELIEKKIKPAVEEHIKINKSRQALWGHSYGGLFVLYVLTSSPESFQAYAAADPALWWGGGEMLKKTEEFSSSGAEFDGINLLIMKSGQESRNRQFDDEKRKAYEARVKAVSSVPADAAKTAAYSFAAVKGITVRYREYPQLSHGPLFPVSFHAALRLPLGQMD
jgi:predicted alpha/beta superfamily hydrolase